MIFAPINIRGGGTMDDGARLRSLHDCHSSCRFRKVQLIAVDATKVDTMPVRYSRDIPLLPRSIQNQVRAQQAAGSSHKNCPFRDAASTSGAALVVSRLSICSGSMIATSMLPNF
jgi:hypothetical protein